MAKQRSLSLALPNGTEKLEIVELNEGNIFLYLGPFKTVSEAIPEALDDFHKIWSLTYNQVLLVSYHLFNEGEDVIVKLT